MTLKFLPETMSVNQRSQEVSSHPVLEYICAFFLVISSYSVFFKHSNISSLVCELLLTLVGCIWLILLYKKINIHLLSFFTIISIVSILCIAVIYGANASSSVLSYVLQKIMMLIILVPMFGLIFSTVGFRYTIDFFMSKVVNLIVFFAMAGLLIWLAIVFGGMTKLPKVSIAYNWGGQNIAEGYLGLLYVTQYVDFLGRLIPRFTLFFVEAPLANFVFQTCLATELLLRTKPRFAVALFLSLCSVLTLSTTGLAMLPIIWLFWLLSSGKQLRLHYPILEFSYWLLIALAVFIIPVWITYSIQNKSNVGSASVHYQDFVSGFNSFLDDPIWGHGIGNYQNSFLDYDGSNGQTSGVLSVLAQSGVLAFILYLIPLFNYWMRGKESGRLRYFSVFLMFLFLIVIIDNSPLFAVYLALGYAVGRDGHFLKEKHEIK